MFTIQSSGAQRLFDHPVPMHIKRTVHNCIYNRLPEDEPSGSKHVEDINN